ncbi:hypothetical protein GCM10009811_12090 [Nostocoides veronense]|uniref:Uncharacterized protein n=1 Tax=Nostocoides veronense TaxID=330836 RepID=A0ABN2LHD0_9MICO
MRPLTAECPSAAVSGDADRWRLALVIDSPAVGGVAETLRAHGWSGQVDGDLLHMWSVYEGDAAGVNHRVGEGRGAGTR